MKELTSPEPIDIDLEILKELRRSNDINELMLIAVLRQNDMLMALVSKTAPVEFKIIDQVHKEGKLLGDLPYMSGPENKD